MSDSLQTQSAEPIGQPAGDDEISLLDIAQLVAENLRLLCVAPLLVGLTALAISFLITPTFSAKTQILPPQQQGAAAVLLQGLGALGGLASAATGLKNPNDQFIAMLRSRTVADSLIDQFELKTRYDAETHVDARKMLESRSSILSGKDGLISVEVEDHDPEIAAKIANAYIDQLAKLLSTLAITEAQQRRMFFEKQMINVKEKLVEAEAQLRGSGVDPSIVRNSPIATVGAIAQVQAQVAAQEVKIAALKGYLSEASPDIRQAQTELRGLQVQLGKLDRGQQPSGGAQGEYVSKYRQVKYFETMFELFAKQYELAKVDEAREGPTIQMVDVAVPPEKKIKPKKALIAVLATLGAGLVVLAYLVIRLNLNMTAQNPAAAAQLEAIRRGFGMRRLKERIRRYKPCCQSHTD